jgi:hypothetical protein
MRQIRGRSAPGVRAFTAAASAIAVLLLAPAAAPAAETELRKEGTYGQTTFLIPNGGYSRASDCPSAQDSLRGIGGWKACHFRLVVQAWSPKAQSLYTVFSDEGEYEEAEPVMDWSCRIDVKTLRWTVEMSTEDSSWTKRETGTFEVFVPGCGRPAVIFRYVGTSRGQARKAVLDHLASFYVSRLRCDRHGKSAICKVTFNNTFSQCNATYRVSRIYNGSFTYSTVTALRKRCSSF